MQLCETVEVTELRCGLRGAIEFRQRPKQPLVSAIGNGRRQRRFVEAPRALAEAGLRRPARAPSLDGDREGTT